MKLTRFAQGDTMSRLDAFTEAYIECALWSSTDINEQGDMGSPLDENYGPEDIAPECLASMVRDCADFQETQADDLAKSGLSDEQAGHDFWLTRNGHGAGFWDRGLGAVGHRLTEASKPYGSVDLYVGDDGLTHGGE